ncbi:MAG: hypothetical protein JSS81_11425 [Acidobacteria bacterium]|nr:hypothetical protein [Acidobacteriota bacterium]
MKKIAFLLTFILLTAAFARADESIPPTPKPTKTPRGATSLDSTLNIRLATGEKQARLIIPKDKLKQLRAELDGLDDADAPTASVFTRTQTVVGGLFLSLGMVFGGVWFVRSGKSAAKKAKIAALVAVVFGAGALATAVSGNIRPPTRKDITSEIFKSEYFQYSGLDGDVRVEVTDSGDKIRLIVPKVEDSSK